MSGFEEIPTHPEQVLNLTMDSQQALGLGNRFEAANLTFLLSCAIGDYIGNFGTGELVWWHAAFGDALDLRFESLTEKYGMLVEQVRFSSSI